MNFSSASMSFGFGASPTQAATTPSPKKSPGPGGSSARESNGVLPVTVKGYLTGSQTIIEGKMIMHGLPTPKVAIVGLVQDATELPACKEYVVNDYTGSVKVLDYNQDGAKVSAGDIVHVVGEPREGGQMSVINMSVQKDPAAITGHRLLAVVTACQAFNHGPIDFSPVKTEAPTKAAEPAVKSEPSAAPADDLSGIDLAEQIKIVAKRRKVAVPPGEEEMGTNVDDIIGDLAKHASEEKVRSAIERLMGDGTAYEGAENCIVLMD